MQREERRRAVFQAVLAKAERLNVKFEDDPGFRASIEEWINGDIDADELRARYRDLVATRRNARKLGFAFGVGDKQ